MKIKITLTSEKSISLPLHYNRTLQGFIYSNLGPVFSTFFHDYGFPFEGKYLKPLTFSRIFGKSKINKQLKRVFFEPPIYFYFSAVLPEVVSDYITRLVKREKLKLGNNEVRFEEAEPVKEEFEGDRVIVKTLSPITIRKTEGRKARYFSPKEPEFYRLLRKNLVKKAKLFSQKEIKEEEVRIGPAPGTKFKKVVALYKGYPVEAYKGRFLISAPKEAIKTALLAGLGERNSQGFGMVILEEEVK
ncbi:CRISPR-associated endoribonuclease Cas6 [Thermovibrio sp.]